jgi:hypothetical protein
MDDSRWQLRMTAPVVGASGGDFAAAVACGNPVIAAPLVSLRCPLLLPLRFQSFGAETSKRAARR